MPKPKPQLHIYYDGDCPMCTVFANNLKTDTSQTLINIAKATDLPKEKEQLLQEIHLYEADGTLRTGADAVLTALARKHSWLTPLTIIFRKPGLRHLANLTYSFVSKRRTLWFGGNTARLYWLYLITTLGLLLGLIFTWPLWGTERLYPTVPFHDALAFLTPTTPFLSYSLLFLLTGGLVLYKHIPVFTRAVLLVLTTLVLLDITRLQPWILNYGLLLGLMSVWQREIASRTEFILDAARFVVVGIYFWSGLQKLNTAFYLETFPWFTEPLWSPLGDTGAYAMLSFGVFVPFIEMAFALGLLTARFRTLSILGSLSMLGIVFASLVFGHTWNEAVWPWNIAICAMVFILFVRHKETLPELLTKTRKNVLAWLMITICIIAPIGNIFGFVDHYLAWSLYSGHVPTATIVSSERTAHLLAPTIRTTDSSSTVVRETQFAHFSLAQTRVVPYPEIWYFKKVFTSLCIEHPEDPYLTLFVTTRPFFLSHEKTILRFTCGTDHKKLY